MKKVPVLLLLMLLYRPLAAQLNLGVKILGLRNDKGIIMLQIFDSERKIIGQERGLINDRSCLIVLKDLKPARYAVRYFHDEDLSGEMETNKLGIPKEGYGFSNNASGRFGPKPFKDWLFTLNRDSTIEITTCY